MEVPPRPARRRRRAEHGTGDAAASAPRRSHPRGAPAFEPQHPGAWWREEDAVCGGGGGGGGEGGCEGGGGGRGAGVLRGREPARPGGGGAADRGGVRVRGPGVPAAHGGAGPGGGLLRRLHGLRQPRPPLRHRRHLRRRPLRRGRHLAPRVEGAAVPVQQGLQLLPLPARPAAAAADPDRVWPGLRGAGDQARGAGAGGHQGSHLDSGALPRPCRQALTHSIHPGRALKPGDDGNGLQELSHFDMPRVHASSVHKQTNKNLYVSSFCTVIFFKYPAFILAYILHCK